MCQLDLFLDSLSLVLLALAKLKHQWQKLLQTRKKTPIRNKLLALSEQVHLAQTRQINLLVLCTLALLSYQKPNPCLVKQPTPRQASHPCLLLGQAWLQTSQNQLKMQPSHHCIIPETQFLQINKNQLRLRRLKKINPKISDSLASSMLTLLFSRILIHHKPNSSSRFLIKSKRKKQSQLHWWAFPLHQRNKINEIRHWQAWWKNKPNKPCLFKPSPLNSHSSCQKSKSLMFCHLSWSMKTLRFLKLKSHH